MKLMIYLTVFALVTCAIYADTLDTIPEFAFLEKSGPIQLNDLQWNDTWGAYNLSGASITGLDQPVSVTTDTVNGQIVYYYDSLNVTGRYWTNGFLFNLLPLFGEGDFNFQAKNVTVTGTGQPQQYDYFFFVFEIVANLQNYVGGGLMSLVADALKIPPIVSDVMFKKYQPNIEVILNGMFNSTHV